MPDKSVVLLAISNEHPGALVAVDADYFQKRGEECLELAERARDPLAAVALRSLATAFEAKAHSLRR